MEPLPVKIIFTCMGLSGVEYEIRETIIGIMSEILPLYGDCLTVYHKSLWDWLTLNGYDEHGFVANVADGIERLWSACKRIYSDISSLRSVSDFQISPERRYALKNGGKFLLDVGAAEDFHWLVNVRLNFLKLKIFDSLNVSFPCILRFYKSRRPDHHYWQNIHLKAFSDIFSDILIMERHNYQRKKFYIYLQSLANGYFDIVQKTIDCKNEARDILDESNEIWFEEMGNEYNSNFKVVSHAILGNDVSLAKLFDPWTFSPDNRLLAYRHQETLEVFKLPSLVMVFELEISVLSNPSRFLIFSPDSSYLLWNSVRSCVSLKEQKEVPLIPYGPESVDCCSFSSCGMKLVSAEKNLLKVWDVEKKSLLVKVEIEFHVKYCLFSNCSSFIVLIRFDLDDIVILKSKTLEKTNID